MSGVGIKYSHKTLLYNLYKCESTIIRIQDNIEKVKINKRVRLGFILSPIIFNAYIQEAIDIIKKNTNLGIRLTVRD